MLFVTALKLVCFVSKAKNTHQDGKMLFKNKMLQQSHHPLYNPCHFVSRKLVAPHSLPTLRWFACLLVICRVETQLSPGLDYFIMIRLIRL